MIEIRRDHRQPYRFVNHKLGIKFVFIASWTNRLFKGKRGYMLRKLYDWIMDLAGHKQAQWILAVVAFAESSFFPIPPDAMLIPMTLAKRKKAWWYAFVCTVGSVLGGIAGYFIGYLLFDSIGQWIIDLYGLQGGFDKLKDWYTEYGLLIVFVAGFTPIPYKVFTISSGVTQLSLPLFIVGSVVSRGLRFLIVCGLIYWFGPTIKDFIEKYLGWLTLLACVVLVGGFIALKYIG